MSVEMRLKSFVDVARAHTQLNLISLKNVCAFFPIDNMLNLEDVEKLCSFIFSMDHCVLCSI